MSNEINLIEKNGKKSKNLIFLLKREQRVTIWSKKEDELLLSLAKKNNYRNWKKVAESFNDKTGVQCYSRYKLINPIIKKGYWTEEEDRELLDLIEVYGKNWSMLSKIITTRSRKQIRDRYNNNLDKNINKERLSKEEEQIILTLYSKFGPNWNLISKHLSGRTNQQIKNKFYGSLFYGVFKDRKHILSHKNLSDHKEEIRNNFEIEEHMHSEDLINSYFNCKSMEKYENSNLKNLGELPDREQELSETHRDKNNCDIEWVDAAKTKNSRAINTSSIIKHNLKFLNEYIQRKNSDDYLDNNLYKNNYDANSLFANSFFNELIIKHLKEKKSEKNNNYSYHSNDEDLLYMNINDLNQANPDFKNETNLNNFKFTNDFITNGTEHQNFLNNNK